MMLYGTINETQKGYIEMIQSKKEIVVLKPFMIGKRQVSENFILITEFPFMTLMTKDNQQIARITVDDFQKMINNGYIANEFAK